MLAAVRSKLFGHTTGVDANPDIAFDLISNPRRRFVIQYLDTHGFAVAGELADELASEENDCTVQELNAQERKRVYISLIQVHLKRLDEEGAIDYDEDRKNATSTQMTAGLAEMIDDAEAHLQEGDA